MTAGWAGLIIGVLGVVGGLVAPVLTRRLTSSQAALATAEAQLRKAEAQRVRFETQRDAADEVRDIAQRAEEAREEARLLRRQLADIRDAAGRHEKWDQLMVETVRAMKDALQVAGIGEHIPDLPDPPPLALQL